MDKIEQQVRLPPGAPSLAHFARYYAFRADGKVLGNYLPPIDAAPSDQNCVEVAPDSKSHPIPCPPEQRRPKAGERVWLPDERELPVVMDAGCAAVFVIFDPRSDKVEQLSCSDFLSRTEMRNVQ
jgi:hypothetical protein